MSAPAGVADAKGISASASRGWTVDDDGWLDLFVANDSTPNYLYLNQRNGTFMDMAFPMGVAVSDDGAEQGSMGVAVGDYANSGRFSLFVTNFAEEYNALYRNDGDHFTDDSFRSNTAAVEPAIRRLGHGVFRLRQRWRARPHRRERPRLSSARDRRARRVSGVPPACAALSRARQRHVRRGRVGLRRDADRTARQPWPCRRRPGRRRTAGRRDQRSRRGPQVLHNELEQRGHWLTVAARGRGGNREAIGAVIEVTAGGHTMRRLVQSGTSYLSQNDMRQHFGLGTATKADVVDVRWPDGSSTRLQNIDADRVLSVEEPAR